MPYMSALRPATLHDLDAVYALEFAGFVPGIVEEKPVFARHIESFGAGFLVRESAEPGWPLEAYFCTEIWAGWPAGTAPLAERFALNHDIGAFHDPAGRALFRDGLAAMRAAFPGLGRPSSWNPGSENPLHPHRLPFAPAVGRPDDGRLGGLGHQEAGLHPLDAQGQSKRRQGEGDRQ
jgi:hypothetical protein